MMSLIKRAPRVSGLCAALMLAAGCESLNVTNPNAPDSNRLLSDPGSVRSLAVGAMETWYNTFENIDPGTTLSVMARSSVAAWNNFQIRFYTGCTYGAPLGPMPAPYDSLGTCGTKNATYPRVEWQNNPASTRRLEIETYWYGYYSALSSANDVLKAIRANGLVISDAATTKMVETMAVLVQALCLGELAVNYDKGFVVDYTTDLTTLQYSGRSAMRAAALAKFDETIALAKANTFAVDPAFFNGASVAYDNVKIAQIANTMAARLLAYFPRDSVENKDIGGGGQVDWARVASYADSGISSARTSGGLVATPFDWVFLGDGCNNWCDGLKNWSNDMTTMRVHTRVAHMLDPATQPDPWPGPSGESQPNSADKRLGDGSFGPVGTIDTTTGGTITATSKAGTDFAWSYDKEIQFAARGLWHQSAIANIRYINVAESPMNPAGQVNGIGEAPVVLAAENDLILAEALIRGPTQDLARAATLINNSRSTRGGLTPAGAGDGAALLLQELQYEQDVELFSSNVDAYYNQRRIDNLEPLTPHEFPVPAQELGVLGEALYTWGGAGNPPNSTPAPPAVPSPVVTVQNAPQIWANIQRVQRARVAANMLLNSLR